MFPLIESPPQTLFTTLYLGLAMIWGLVLAFLDLLLSASWETGSIYFPGNKAAWNTQTVEDFFMPLFCMITDTDLPSGDLMRD